MPSKLALLGGVPVRKIPYPPHITAGAEEKAAVDAVMDKGVLSEFEGTNNQYFLGGEQVKLLEKEWGEKFHVKHAVSFNSATSALYASIGASSIGPADEVIVTPYTMSSTATAILAYNAIPVFSDIELDYYNLDPAVIESRITSRTRAIFVVHIFGHPVDMDPVMAIAKRHGLKVIEDAAQSLGGLYNNRPTGTIGDIGVYSLNCNKIIQCGEGGIAVTNDDILAEKLRLIRNHAEAVIASGRKAESLVNMIGWNYRMNEIEAAISRVQLGRLDGLLSARTALVKYLSKKVEKIEGLRIPHPRKGSTHVYYRYALKVDIGKTGVKAPLIVKALNAEGMDFYVSYMKPLYLQPIYQNLIAYGDKGCPFKCPWYKGRTNYSKGICPNAEKLEDIIISTEIIRPPQDLNDMDEIYEALDKVFSNLGALREYKCV
ncbi:MAG: DegT/DnrJ/EryC1/StrS family aminotransferase [Candidatus Omnitrophota bacterium]|jgi:dTDP-4-amino-4,6-dideoxygalactose transaminase